MTFSVFSVCFSVPVLAAPDEGDLQTEEEIDP